MKKIGNKTILIVEDEESLRSILMDKFRFEKFKVHGAKNGEEGLEKVMKIIPDIILLDIVMPKMNGMIMLRKMKDIVAVKDIPVIVLSNLSDVPQIIKTLEFGTELDEEEYNESFTAETASDYAKKYLKARFNDTGYDFVIKSNIKLEELTKRVNLLLCKPS